MRHRRDDDTGEHNECLAELEKVRYKDVVVVVIAAWEQQMPFSESMYHDDVDKYGGARYVSIHAYPEDFEAALIQLFGEWWEDGNKEMTTFDPFDGYKVEMGEQKQVFDRAQSLWR
jgi:hypothetical protein